MDFAELAISELYLDQPSYFAGENVKIYSSTNSWFSFDEKITITTVSGKEVDNFVLKVNPQDKIFENTLEDGFGYTQFQAYHIPNNLESGIYLINDKYPLVVKARNVGTITVVYPWMNNVLFQSVKNNNVLSKVVPSSSLQRTSLVDNFTKGMGDVFSKEEYRINYISDLDLEEKASFSTSKLLVIYGKSIFWTPKMKESVATYLAEGGNLLLITSYTMNDVCWYNNDEHRIIFFNQKERNHILTWYSYNATPPEETVGVSYVIGGYSNDKSYMNANEGHSIMEGISSKIINIKANLFTAPPVKWYDDLPRIDLDSLGFYKGKIIAYSRAAYHKEDNGIKGIFVLQPDSTSGKIISLGTEDWLLQENIGENKQIQIITKNAIDYLLE